MAIHGVVNFDRLVASFDIMTNVNILHQMVLSGDIRCMEALIAHGASIDHPFLNEKQCGGEIPIVAPTDATVLVLLCATYAVNASLKMDYIFNANLTESWKCAIQLVKLGADCEKKLNIPRHPGHAIFEKCRLLDFEGLVSLICPAHWSTGSRSS
jgi:hypothetical protein